MRVIVWGINYAPEVTGIAPFNTALCRYLSEAGHSVGMVTTFPYYPEWKKRAGDEGVVFRDEIDGKVAIHRCWHFVPEKPGALKRVAHEASFVITSFFRFLFLKRPDVFVVVSPPLLLGAAAWVLSVFKRVPFVFHVQDLQPDAAFSLGMVNKAGVFSEVLYGLERLAYRKAARLSGISAGMLDAFKRKGVPEKKLLFFPNSAEFSRWVQRPPRGVFRGRMGWGKDDFLIVYSGNLGVKQGLSILLESAALWEKSEMGAGRVVRWVLCGDGALRGELEQKIRLEQLSFAHLIPLQSEEGFAEMMADADICAVSERPGAGASFLPSKLLTCLACGRPALLVADEKSEMVRLNREKKFGVHAEPSPRYIVSAVREIISASTELAACAKRGEEWVRQFDQKLVLDNFASELKKLI